MVVFKAAFDGILDIVGSGLILDDTTVPDNTISENKAALVGPTPISFFRIHLNLIKNICITSSTT